MIAQWIVRQWKLILVLMALVSIVLGAAAFRVKVDPGFLKLLPREHEYVKTFFKYQRMTGGGNRVYVALVQKEGDIFQPDFFRTLKEVTDEIASLKGVDRGSVTSLFTPNVKYSELVEGGIVSSRIVDASFQPVPEQLERVRQNVLRSTAIGRLVSSDLKAAMVTADLVEIDPSTGEKVDYVGVAHRLEEEIRRRYESPKMEVRIVGFVKLVGDLVDALGLMLRFGIITIVISFLLLWLANRSAAFALLPIACASLAVVWQVGLVTLFGFGIDPLNILVCFIIFVTTISHAVQVVNSVRLERSAGADPQTAAERTLRTIWLPATLANATDFIGYFALFLVPIDILREVAISALLGQIGLCASVLVGLPAFLSRWGGPIPTAKNAVAPFGPGWIAPIADRLVELMSRFTTRRMGAVAIAGAAVVTAAGLIIGEPEVGDLHPGAPEFSQDSRYNQDVASIHQRFSMGMDVLAIYGEAKPDACLDYASMELIDQLDWRLRGVPGVQGVVDLPWVIKQSYVGWNEGNPRWTGLPRSRERLATALTGVETGTGLLNDDCSVLPVLVFTKDHTAGTIRTVVSAVKDFGREVGEGTVKLHLAGGNVGLMAATNEAIQAAQNPMRFGVFAGIILVCFIWFRSVRAVIVVVTPLAVVSVAANALMAWMRIGLTPATSPVVALGAGIGVDFSIYIYGRLAEALRKGESLQDAYRATLRATGKAVLLTAATLSTGIGVWTFSPLKFQSEMGLLLSLVLAANVVGALVLLPAMAAFLAPRAEATPSPRSP